MAVGGEQQGSAAASKGDGAVLAYAGALGAVVLFTTEAAIAKLIGPGINAPQVSALRCVVQIVVLALLLNGHLREALKTTRVRGHLWRGFLSATSSAAYFYVFGHMAFAPATVIFFSSVLFTTMLAGPILRERVGVRRWTASLVGFAGVLMVARPGAVPFDLTLAVAFFLALCSAALQLSTKALTRTESTATIMLWIALTTLAINLPASLVVWTWPTAREFWLMMGIAAAGTLGQYASITSFRHAEASGIAPVQYLRIVLAAFLGWLVFGEALDPLTLMGSAVVTVSALAITVIEIRQRRMSPPPV